ncbi:MAG: J domain-containing protein [Deltaproteobacteria bacterium]|nr:J domain-containing protein [Deltaproteobacteria bacterium]
MAKRDYYEVLGVSRDVDPKTLKSAYRKLARELHPDRNPDPAAEDAFKEATEAYQVLSDPEKRSTYDRFGHAGVEGQGFIDPADIFGGLQDMLGDFFGGFRRRRPDAPSRGANVRTAIELELFEALHGVTREIELRHAQPCDSCEGTGADGGAFDSCQRCNGMGRLAVRRGAFVVQVDCPDCDGQGRTPKSPCGACEGSGQTISDRKVQVEIPGGVDHGDTLRVQGEGQSGIRGGPPGHLLVDLRVHPHPQFTRNGDDLVHPLHLSFPQAALGARVAVPGLRESDDGYELIVPPGIQPGETLIIEGEGAPRRRGRGRGDVVCVVQVDVPRDLSPRAKELIEELAQSFGG